MDEGMLRLESDGGDLLEARLHNGIALSLMIEVEDVQRDRGDVVRTSFMPTKAQARSLAEMLAKWGKA